MEKELFEIIVKHVTKSDSKTKKIMDIAYSMEYFGDYTRCSEGHFHRRELFYCPYCEPIGHPID
jgi:hypothetical protein